MTVLAKFIRQRHGNMPASVTYFPDPPLITPGLSRVSIVLTWSRSTGSVPYRPTAQPSVDRRSVMIAVLLLLAGDVEINPGPQSSQRSADQLTASLNVELLKCCSAVNKAAQIHSCEGSAPRGAATSWSVMACAGNAIPGRVPQPKNPVVGQGEDSGRPNISLAWFTVSPCVRGLNEQPSDRYNY